MHERYYELLTSFVDGELSSRQRKAALRLLKKSPDARRLLRQLQEDAQALRDLPRPQLDRDLSADVVGKIRQGRLQPLRRRQARAPATIPAWTGLAVAASVLFLIGGVSYVYFIYSEQAASVADLDNKNPTAKDASTLAKNDNGSAPEKDKAPGPVLPFDTNVKPDVPRTAHVDPDKSQRVTPDEPRRDHSKDLTAPPGLPPFDPTKVEVPFLPVVVNLRELDQDKSAAPLREVLTKSTAFRLEVPCNDTNKGLDRLQKILNANGFVTLVDSVALARAKQKVRTSYVLYAENLTRDELFRLMKQLGIDDPKAGDGQMHNLIVTKLGRDDYKELSGWLSSEISQPAFTKPAGSLGIDPRKPLAEGTADQVIEKLKGQASPKTTEHFALIAAPNATPGSSEVKRFFDLRKPAKPDCIHIMLVLRAPNG